MISGNETYKSMFSGACDVPITTQDIAWYIFITNAAELVSNNGPLIGLKEAKDKVDAFSLAASEAYHDARMRGMPESYIQEVRDVVCFVQDNKVEIIKNVRRLSRITALPQLLEVLSHVKQA